MLTNCDAVCISPQGDSTMRRLAERVGFRSATEAGTDWPPGPICFHLIDYRVEERRKLEVLARVRANLQPNVRFSPLIIVVGELPAGTIANYVQWGFDDIVALPGHAPNITERFESHLGRPIVYYETDSYFGPDRRRMHRAPLRDGARPRTGYFEHRFTRDPVTGVAAAARQEIPAAAGTPGMLEILHQLEGQ